MFKPTDTYGLLIERADDPARFGLPRTIRVRARLVRREADKQHPLNPPNEDFGADFPPHLKRMTLEDLAMLGWVSDYGAHDFIGYEPTYYNRYRIGLRNAERMVKTLKHIGKRFEKDAAFSAVDQFVSLCTALRLEFVVERIGDQHPGEYLYSDHNWRWMSIAEGRNRYRAMIEAARAEVIEAAIPKVPAGWDRVES